MAWSRKRHPQESPYFRVVGFCRKCGDVKVRVATGRTQCGCKGQHMLDSGFPRAKVKVKVKAKAKIARGYAHHSSYPEWMREIVLEIYRQGYGSSKIQILTGVSNAATLKWAKAAGISRTHAEAASAGRADD